MENLLPDEMVVLQHCRQGNRSAFEQIVHTYMKQAYFIALGLVGNHDDALELSQEAFYRAYYNINRLNPTKRFFPWFYQILKNLCFSHLRKARVRKSCSLDAFEQAPADTHKDHFDPELLAQKNEMQQRIWQAIGRLNEKHREIIILRHFQGLSYDQIAEALHCSKETVMSRLFHARKKLKDLLSGKGGLQV